MADVARGHHDLEPGLTLCAVCRSADAECVEDPGERWARPLCFDCADDVIDRLNAAGLNRDAVDVIMAAREDPVGRLPAPRLLDWETADQSRLAGLRAQWRAYERLGARTLAGASRCWAIVSGARCVRDEVGDGLCETHQVQGCRLPGLGWRGDEPMGPILARRGKGVAA